MTLTRTPNTRVYGLRGREVPVAAAPVASRGTRASSLTRGESPFQNLPESPSLGGLNSETPMRPLRRSFSDVVVGRTPLQGHSVPEETLAPSVDRGQRTTGEVGDRRFNKNEFIKSAELSDERPSSPDTSSSENENEDGVWTTVTRKRRSSKHERRDRKAQKPAKDAGVLTREQVQVVSAAANTLSEPQKDRIARRFDNMHLSDREQSLSRGEGPSQPKGKGVDPREWGNVDLDEPELNVEAQRQAFEEYSRARRLPKATGKNHSPRVHGVLAPGLNLINYRSDSEPVRNYMSHSRMPEPTVRLDRQVPKNTLPRESRPIAQVDPKSYLGVALEQVARRSHDREIKSRRRHSSSGPSSSSSSSSGSGSSDSDDYDRDRRTSRRHRSRGHRHKRRRRSRSSSRHQAHKVFKPRDYDGKPDHREYLRFVKESSDYIEDCKIKPKRMASTLAHFLKGKAYEFYIHKVSLTEEQWTLREFYDELFNYCFPVNYRSTARAQLNKSYQNDRSVAEFSYAMEELFNIIGSVSERDRVNYLWKGLRTSIQKALWRDGLNPEISSWDEILAKAEIIEISESVVERGSRETRSGSSRADRPIFSSGSAIRGARPGVSRSGNGVEAASSRQEGTSRGHSISSRGSMQRRAPRGSFFRKQFSSSVKRESATPSLFPKLTEKEMAERRADGRCFRCNGHGHLSRNCPEGNIVKSPGNKPPGVTAFSMQIAEEDEPEVLDSLPLGFISFGDPNLIEGQQQSIWSVEQPNWMRVNKGLPRKSMGDVPQMWAKYLLDQNQPYPGDEQYAHRLRYIDSDRRFFVDPVEEGSSIYAIRDKLTSFYVRLDKHRIEDGRFNLPNWYATRRSNHLGLDRPNWKPRNDAQDPYETVMRHLLTDGIQSCYPNSNLEQPVGECRFAVQKPGSWHAKDYNVLDLDLDINVAISPTLVHNPEFDLVSWHRTYLDVSGFYASIYATRAKQLVTRLRWAQEDEELDSDDERLIGLPPMEQPSDSDDDSMPELESVPEQEEYIVNHDLPSSAEIWAQEHGVTQASAGDQELQASYWTYNGECYGSQMGNPLFDRVSAILSSCQPFPGDAVGVIIHRADDGPPRFRVKWDDSRSEYLSIYDSHRRSSAVLHRSRLREPLFSLGAWYADLTMRRYQDGIYADTIFDWLRLVSYPPTVLGRILEDRVEQLLLEGMPYSGDTPILGSSSQRHRFAVMANTSSNDYLKVYDCIRDVTSLLLRTKAEDPLFEPHVWYESQLNRSAFEQNLTMELTREVYNHTGSVSGVTFWAEGVPAIIAACNKEVADHQNGLALNAIQVDRAKFAAVSRTAALVKDKTRVLPKSITVKVLVNSQPVLAMLDSGSLGDFMSTTLADQLRVHREDFASPLPLQLAVQGSRSKINASATARFQYQGIDEPRTFDIVNLNGHDLILGTPWMYQHQVCLGFNPARVVIGSDTALDIMRGNDTRVLAKAVPGVLDEVEQAREDLRRYAAPLCKEVSETELPPIRAINHTIPLIDVNKTYPWRPSRCPEAFRSQWVEKRDAYLRTGRWKITSSGNTVPMLLIPKPKKDGSPPELRTVFDLRERNKNTVKLTSPLPDMEGMLRRAASKKYRTALDLKSAYEQIRIVPEHVDRTTVTTPDGNMVSQVIQIGDCNAPATYQVLMNHLFSAFIGRFMDIYLDDIVIYSDSLVEHVKHVKLVLDVLKHEKLYLSAGKLRFISPELRLLGRIIDDHGIRMDAEKVDSVLKWKVPTNRDLLHGFLGSVGYLADDVPGVRIPMGVLTALTGDTVPFRWRFTEQRAFEDVKALVEKVRSHSRVPMTYGVGALPVWMVTDGCATGIAGVVSQGADWKTAKVAAFYSAKLNPAQQNYPVHEIEMLAGVETMIRHADILQGVRFKWLTDHKGLIFLLNQKNLSGRQARWLEKISSFDFEVVYLPGVENVVADALSRLYSNDAVGTVRARSEYTYHDVVDEDSGLVRTDMPVLAGLEACAAVVRRPRLPRAASSKRVETSREFAARMAGRFVLRGPVERKEGRLADDVIAETINNPIQPVITTDDDQRYHTPDSEKGTLPSSEEATIGSALKQAPEISETIRAGGQQDILLDLTSHSNAGLDLRNELQGKYKEDILFSKVLEHPKDFRNFEVKEGLIYLRDRGKKLLCVPRILVNGRSVRELIIAEAHSLLAHLGASKTIDYLREQVWWKDLISDTRAYCETCMICKRSKPSNQKPYGLLNPLPIPGTPWESIGVDFVGPLPVSSNRDGNFDCITVVICLLTAMVHLIPSRITYNAKQLAELMFEEVYKLHGIPRNIISDRDVLFTSIFWRQLHKLIGTSLKMSSAYHPQTDGSTERANRTVTQMLRQCVSNSQSDWVQKLPAIEFAINSARSASTGFAPFFLNHGQMPRAMIWNSAPRTEFPTVHTFALNKKLAIMEAHDCIIAARVKQTRDANRKRQDTPFSVGDLVYLSTKDLSFKKGLARKLIPKFVGPYRILEDFHDLSYRIELPSHLKRSGVSDVRHASHLRIHHPNDDRLFPGRLDTQVAPWEDDSVEDEWAIESILSHVGTGRTALFEIKWSAGDITWLNAGDLAGSHALAQYLEALGVEEVDKIPKGAGQPPSDDPQIFVGAIELVKCGTLIYPSEVEGLEKTHLSVRHPNMNYTTQPALAAPPYSFSHPSIQRLTDNIFAFTDAQGSHYVMAAGEIYLMIQVDGRIRDTNTVTSPLPASYDLFVSIYNNHPNGPWRFAQRFSDGSFSTAGHRMDISVFGITLAQCGFVVPTAPADEELVIRDMMMSELRRNYRFKQCNLAQATARKEVKLVKAAVSAFSSLSVSGSRSASGGKKRKGKKPYSKKQGRGALSSASLDQSMDEYDDAYSPADNGSVSENPM